MGEEILCVTLNASIDTTHYIERLNVGGVARSRHTISQAGGKGNNVARAITRLGGNVRATGFVGGRNGRFIVERLKDEGISNAFIEIEHGESRTCLALVDESTQQTTEILERGIQVTKHDLDAFMNQLEQLIRPGMYIVFSGSLPQGVGTDDFCEMVELSGRLGARVMVDSSGDALRAVLGRGGIYAVKPNQTELDDLISAYGPHIQTESTIDFYTRALQWLHECGVGIPVVTLGKQGALAFDGEAFCRVTTPAVDTVNAVGSGDSFLAGFTYSQSQGESLELSLGIAAAAGAANATVPSAGMIHRDEVMQLAREVVYHRT